ncbi:kinase-like domain-containing protein [Haematococcus lacustris]
MERFSKPLKTLGEGTYGTVYLCVDKAAPDGPCYVAIKSFKSQELEEQAKALAVREAKLLAAVRGHPNIVHLHHAYMTRSGQLYLVQEYVENSLAQQLEVHSPKGLPHGMACSIIRQLLEALAFMHSRSVTHRDIKMANVLLRNDGCVKLCDFGMATSLAPAVQPGGGPGGLQPSDSTAEAQLTSYVVTRWYRSPEVLLEQPYNEGVDVWSVGCLFAELLFNRPLYPGRSHIDQLALVAAGTAMILPEHLATLRANYRMCGVDIPLPQPSTAQGATQLQQQAAVYQRMSGMLLPAMREFLAATLHPDPLLRATAAELLQLPIMQTAQRVPAVPGPSLPPAAAVLKQLEEAEAAKAEATGQATGAKQPVVKPSRSMRRGVEEGIPAAVPAEQRGLAEAPGFSASRAACASPPPPHSLSPMLASRHADKVDGQRSPSTLRAIHDPNRSRTPDRSLLRVPSAGRRSSQSPLVAPSSQSPATSRHTSPACRHSYTPNGEQRLRSSMPFPPLHRTASHTAEHQSPSLSAPNSRHNLNHAHAPLTSPPSRRNSVRWLLNNAAPSGQSSSGSCEDTSSNNTASLSAPCLPVKQNSFNSPCLPDQACQHEALLSQLASLPRKVNGEPSHTSTSCLLPPAHTGGTLVPPNAPGRPTSARPLRGQSDLNTRLLRSSLSSTSVVIEGSGAGNALGHGVEVQAAVPGLRAPVSGRRSHMQHSAGSQPPDSSSAAKEGLSLASLLLPARSPGREARNGPAPWDETEGKSAGPSSCEVSPRERLASRLGTAMHGRRSAGQDALATVVVQRGAPTLAGTPSTVPRSNLNLGAQDRSHVV